MRANPLRVSLVLALGLAVAACGSSSKPSAAPATTVAPVIDPGDGGNYHPRIDPANFVTVIDNPYMPFKPGATWRYEGMSDGSVETDDVTVTDQRKQVMGIDAVVVHDVVKHDGEVVEDTFDWYAQDKDGNVWYLGEDSKELEHGKLVGTAGSWQGGVDGALPGIVMPAVPKVGHAYRQEFYRGEAEDLAKVHATGKRVTVKAGSYPGVVVTEEWSPLEPKVIELKSYAKGVGVILEDSVAGPPGRSELVAYTPAS